MYIGVNVWIDFCLKKNNFKCVDLFNYSNVFVWYMFEKKKKKEIKEICKENIC